MLYVTKKVSFSASHRLFNPTWDNEKNQEIFDKCNNQNGHGHNYVLEVTVKGFPDPDTGYVFDLKKMKQIIENHLLIFVDHKHLNHDVDFLNGIIPTAENMAVKFWEVLKDKFNPATLHKLKIWETDNSMVEYYGDKVHIHKYEI